MIENAGAGGVAEGKTHILTVLRPLKTLTSSFSEPEGEIHSETQLADGCKSHAGIL